MSWLDRIGSTIDNVALALAPAYGAQRIATRKAMRSFDRVTNLLEASEKNDSRGYRFPTEHISTASMVEEDLPEARRRSRHLYRDDAVGGSLEGKVTNVVGTGFTVQSTIPDTIPNHEELREAQEKMFEWWAESPTVDGIGDLTEFMELCDRVLNYDGEIIVVKSDISTPDRPVPFAVEVIDADRLETPPDRHSDPFTRAGVTTDKTGRPTLYHIRQSVPDDTKLFSIKYDAIPAHRVLHVFTRWFPAQPRGLPWITRSLNSLKDTKDYQEAMILAAQLETYMAGFVPVKGNPIAAAAGATTEVKNGQNIQAITPGSLHYINADSAPTFLNPSKPGNNFAPFMTLNNRRACTGMNYPYEMAFGDWGGTSFAGGRLVLHAGKLVVQVEQRKLDKGILRPLWKHVIDEAVVLGRLPISIADYQAKRRDYQSHIWTAQQWGYAINPGEEVDALIKAVNENLMTKSEAVAARGGNFEDVAKRRAKEVEIEKANNIVPPLVQQLTAQAEATNQQAAAQQAGDNE